VKEQQGRKFDARYLFAGSLILLLVVAFPLAAAASLDGKSYSGDDPYDPAAGGFPGLYLSVDGSLSGDDAYDLAAGALPERGALVFAAGFSGDDAYDPAAGSHPSLFQSSKGSYSGDDAYDAAAGGLTK